MANCVELRPNKLLLDSNFDGYKLSLRQLANKKRNFQIMVDRILLNSSQFSVLHTKLFGWHNHLIGDVFDENESVYFVDEDWNINKIYIDSLCDELTEPIIIWQIPKVRERTTGDYNVSMKFVSINLAVVADGTGFLYILQTCGKENDNKFTLSFSEEVAGPNEGFVILDTFYNQKKSDPELHLLLISIIQKNPNERYSSLLHWITLTQKNYAWTQTALKQLKTKGIVQYAAIETSGEAVYVTSDSECEIILNSDCPVSSETSQNIDVKYSYEWSQSMEDISINIELIENPNKDLIHVHSEPTHITITYDNKNLICGPLHQRVDTDITTWTLEKNTLNVTLYKQETGLVWTQLVVGDQKGKQIMDSCIVDQVDEKLDHFTSDGEVCKFFCVTIIFKNFLFESTS